jgi:stage V sporulation protein G
MDVTQVRVFPVEEEKLKAFVSIIIDDCFVVSDIKIIQGNNGLFISMPSKKRKNGTFRDIAHPLNSETRRKIEERIIAEYRDVLATSGGAPAAEIRRIEDTATRAAGPAGDAGLMPEGLSGGEEPWS